MIEAGGEHHQGGGECGSGRGRHGTIGSWEVRLGRGYQRDRRTRHRAASPGGCPLWVDDKEAGDKARWLPTPSYFHFIAQWGACGKPRVVPYTRQPRPETDGHNGHGRSNMRLLFAVAAAAEGSIP